MIRFENKFWEKTYELLLAVVFLSFFGWMMLSKSPSVFWVALLLLLVIEGMALTQYFKAAYYGDLIFEGSHFLVFLSVGLHCYFHPHGSNNLVLILTTCCYRTDRLQHYSRLFVAVVSILILFAVLPVTMGIIEDDSLLFFFLGSYVFLVASLWFSKLASWYSEI